MKRHLIIYIMALWTTCASAQFLREGDTIAVISPSSAITADAVRGGIKALESWGYH